MLWIRPHTQRGGMGAGEGRGRGRGEGDREAVLELVREEAHNSRTRLGSKRGREGDQGEDDMRDPPQQPSAATC